MKCLELFNLLGLLVNFIGAMVMAIKGTPEPSVGAVIYEDGGESLNKKFRKNLKLGLMLFCIGFAIQLIYALIVFLK